MEKEIKVKEFVITFINDDEGCQDIEIIEADTKELANEKFKEEFGDYKIILTEQII